MGIHSWTVEKSFYIFKCILHNPRGGGPTIKFADLEYSQTWVNWVPSGKAGDSRAEDGRKLSETL